MPLRNDHGKPVDPVPFLVVVAGSFLFCYSFGPPYWMALGFSMAQALALTTAAFAAVSGVGYHRLVLRARPDLRVEVPVAVRFRRLIYAMLALLAAFVLLSLPLVGL